MCASSCSHGTLNAPSMGICKFVSLLCGRIPVSGCLIRHIPGVNTVFKDSTILVTGGTGSFGHAFVRQALDNTELRKIIIYSRDEMKQWDMAKAFNNDPRIRFFIGDVRDKDRLYRAMDGVDYVVHAAAMKIVPSAEYNPFECIKTNIDGAMHVIDAAIDRKVKRVVALSTDKASSPANLYGATKLASDKLFVSGNAYSGANGTRFSVVRYGNVMCSRGSVIPFFQQQAKLGELPITDPRMTRFMITLNQSVEAVWNAFDDMVGGEIYIRKIPSMTIGDIAKAVAPAAKHKIVGIRPGEKLHEQMISVEDSYSTFEYAHYYKILPAIHDWSMDPARIKEGQKVPEGFEYTSDSNADWMDVEALQFWLHGNTLKHAA